MLFFLIITALMTSCIELEIAAPGFPDMVQALSTCEKLVEMTITCNLVGFCIASFIYGPLSEKYGRRPIMLVGNGMLALGALACVMAPSIQWLLVARFLQGLGAATSAVVVSAIIADVYDTPKAAKLYGYMNAIFTSLMALAPLLGGLITSTLGWRGNYGVVAMICILSWLLIFFFLKETHLPSPKVPLKKLFAGYKDIFRPLFFQAAIIPSLLYGCYITYVAVAPFIYRPTFNFDLTLYTLHQSMVIGVFAIVSVFASYLTKLMGPKRILTVACCACLAGSIALFLSSTAVMLTASMSFFNIGFALIYPLVFAKSLEIAPYKGIASSAIMGLRYLVCSFITLLSHEDTLGWVIIIMTFLSTFLLCRIKKILFV